MTERYGSYPPDEPVIGLDYPPPTPRGTLAGPPGVPVAPYPEGEFAPDEWDEAADGDEEYDEDEYYDDEEFYAPGVPARQPLFYVFIGLAAIVGGILIFALFSFVRSSGDSGAAGPPALNSDFDVRLDAPTMNERFEAGRDLSVVIKAVSNEPLTRVQLFLNDRPVNEQSVTDVPANKVYTFAFTVKLPTRGDYSLGARVTSTSKATKDSPKIKVTAYEPIGDRPVSIKGKVVAPTVARAAPRDDADEVKRLSAGEEVNILGKTRDNEWLLVDAGQPNGSWVKRAAIEEADSLALVPIRDATPTPFPTATARPPTSTPSPTTAASPSPTATATLPAGAPDFVPQNAVLIDGGARLRVTVANLGTSGFTGAVEVAVSGVPADPATKVTASIPANGAVTVDFELSPAVTAQASVQVKVDPKNAVRETNEDNNTATFVLTPPVESPNLAITSATCTPPYITVLIANSGGELRPTAVTIRLRFGNDTIERTEQLAMAKGQAPITVLLVKPGANSGQATVQLVIAAQPVGSPVTFTLC